MSFFERDIGIVKSGPDQEGNDTRGCLELTHLDIVGCRPGAGRNEQFLFALGAHRTHNPDAVPCRTLFEGRSFAEDLDMMPLREQVTQTLFSRDVDFCVGGISQCNSQTL